MTTQPVTTSYDADGVQWAWDATSLKTAWTCPRMYYYKMIEGWQPNHARVHLWFGKIYADALELYHKLMANGTDREKAIAEVVYFALVESWDHDLDDEGNRIPGTGGPARFDHNTKTRENLIRTIIWYLEEFKDETHTTFILDNNKPAVELSFRLPVDDSIIFCGHMDRLCKDHDNSIFVHDQKTTGSTIGPYYWRQFKPDIQFSMYTFIGKMAFNVPVSGLIVDAAQIAVGFSKFGRAPILFTDPELNEWFDETMEVIQRTQHYTREQFFPRNTTACNNFGGCEFREVCARPHSVRENFLSGDFTKKERWDPVVPR